MIIDYRNTSRTRSVKIHLTFSWNLFKLLKLFLFFFAGMLDLLIEAKQEYPSWLESVAADGRVPSSGRRGGKGRYGGSGGNFGSRDYRQQSGGSGGNSGGMQRNQRSGGGNGSGSNYGNNGYGNGKIVSFPKLLEFHIFFI